MTDDEDDSRWEQIREDNEAIIREHGWMVQNIAPRIGEQEASWAYTIGLEDRGRPELVVTSLPARVAQYLLNQVVQDSLAGTHEWPQAGDVLEALLEGDYQVRIVAVDGVIAEDGDWFNTALVRRGSRKGFRALQLVWQEVDRSWPTEDSMRQPLLGDVWW